MNVCYYRNYYINLQYINYYIFRILRNMLEYNRILNIDKYLIINYKNKN